MVVLVIPADRSIYASLSPMQDVAWDYSKSKITSIDCRRAQRPGSPDTCEVEQPQVLA